MNSVDWRTRKSNLFNDYICVFAFIFFNELILFFLPCSSLEGSVIQISDQGLRKVLYQKVCLYLYIYSAELSTHADVCCRSWLRSLDGCLLAKYLEMVRFFLCVFFFFKTSYRRGDLVSVMKKKLEKEEME